MIVAEPEITDVADLKTIDSNKTVEAIIYLQAHEISNHGFLEHYFNFAAYNELPRRANVKNVVLTVLLCIMIQWLPTIRNLYDTLLPEPELPKTYHIKHQHEQLTDTTPFLNVNNQQYEDPEQEKLTNHFPLATILEVNPQNYQSFQAFKKISQEHPTPWYYGNRIKDAHERKETNGTGWKFAVTLPLEYYKGKLVVKNSLIRDSNQEFPGTFLSVPYYHVLCLKNEHTHRSGYTILEKLNHTSTTKDLDSGKKIVRYESRANPTTKESSTSGNKTLSRQ
ncbi:hypothetical protein Tco_0858037 [Tanacetum coccineum]|uniref:Uncharacterized protein n=1 Tax=Tanacetum coccineum TaxID=301880 RepID=A0ABQ5B7Y3_9ASTR